MGTKQGKEEIQHCVGIIIDGFEDQFVALLIGIEAGQMNSKDEFSSAKKRARELKRTNL